MIDSISGYSAFRNGGCGLLLSGIGDNRMSA